MCGVTGMEDLMAERIKAIIIANPAPVNRRFNMYRHPDTNTYCLTSHHITSAILLPDGHPVRILLAAEAVEGYLRFDKHKFLKECREIPAFSADLLAAVKDTLKTVYYHDKGDIMFRDPMSETALHFVTESGL
jgi:hypothetical protein